MPVQTGIFLNFQIPAYAGMTRKMRFVGEKEDIHKIILFCFENC